MASHGSGLPARIAVLLRPRGETPKERLCRAADAVPLMSRSGLDSYRVLGIAAHGEPVEFRPPRAHARTQSSSELFWLSPNNSELGPTATHPRPNAASPIRPRRRTINRPWRG